jgi:hypothetical protein
MSTILPAKKVALIAEKSTHGKQLSNLPVRMGAGLQTRAAYTASRIRAGQIDPSAGKQL